MPPLAKTVLLLVASNVFMTIAWYGHLKSLKDKALWIAILASWGIAFFEYCLQVPANRAGKLEAGLALGQVEFGDQLAQPLQRDGVAVFVVVFDDLLLMLGIVFGHGISRNLEEGKPRCDAPPAQRRIAARRRTHLFAARVLG